MVCIEDHTIRKVLEKYIKQSPEENIKMFEQMDRESKHGTWFYGLWKHSRETIYSICEQKLKEEI